MTSSRDTNSDSSDSELIGSDSEPVSLLGSSFIKHVHFNKVKVKWSRYRPGVAQRVGRGVALLFHDRGTRRGWVVSSTPRTLPPGKTRYPFYRRMGGPEGRSGRAENLVPTGFRSRIVQLVVSRYTDWATRPTMVRSNHKNSNRKEAKSVFHHFCPGLPVSLTLCPIKQCGTLS